MAKVKVADVITVADTMVPYMVQESTQNSALYQSGIISNDDELDSVAAETAMTVRMPFWNDLSGQSEGLSDTTALTPDKITAAQDRAVKHYRGKAWAANQLAKWFAGSDPIAVIYDRIAAWWMRDMQSTILFNELAGVFGTVATPGTLAATNQSNISTAGAVTDGNRIGSNAIIGAAGLLGDRWNEIVAMAMHSLIFQRLQILGLVTFVSLEDQDIQVPFFLGRRVIVDDTIVALSGAGTANAIYPVYLFGPGAIAIGNADIPLEEALEADRDILAGDDIIASRRHFVMHPRGVAFTGTYTGQTPAVSDLTTVGNWTKVWDTKNVRIVRLLVNP